MVRGLEIFKEFFRDYQEQSDMKALGLSGVTSKDIIDILKQTYIL